MKKLPKKLSSLLELAVNDAQALFRTKRFVEDMGSWLVALPGEKCSVCLAGAVMSRTLDTDRPEGYSEINPDDPQYDSEIRAKLFAINSMRTGEFEVAWREINGSDEPISERKRDAMIEAEKIILKEYKSYAPQNAIRGRAPWRAYRHAIRVLKAAGL